MKVLMISSDPGIHEQTAAAQRIEEYRQLVDELYTVVIAGRFNIGAFFRAYRKGARILRAHNAGIFLITAQDPAERWLVGWLLSRRFGVPLEIQIHTDITSPHVLRESFKNRVRLRIARFLFPRAGCIRVVSVRIQRSLVAYMPNLAEKITVLPVYVDVEKFQTFHRVEEHGVFRFLMVSRLTREKNIELAIHAFAEIHKDFPDTKLIIVGDGPYRHRLEALALKYRLMQGAAVFTGWEEHVLRHFQYANCYLLTSNYEGYGRTVIEALSVGVPVIMTDVGIAGDIVKNEESGLIVPIGNKMELMKAMRRFLTDSYIRKTLYENSRTAVRACLSKKDYLEAYKHMWHTCSSKNA